MKSALTASNGSAEKGDAFLTAVGGDFAVVVIGELDALQNRDHVAHRFFARVRVVQILLGIKLRQVALLELDRVHFAIGGGVYEFNRQVEQTVMIDADFSDDIRRVPVADGSVSNENLCHLSPYFCFASGAFATLRVLMENPRASV
jgi:hypothetical protein